jgi:hypothetical protein
VSGALRLSLSQPYALRWVNIEYNLNGQSVDPRPLFVPQFQLIVPGTTTFATWANGTWDALTPASGPYAARITVGTGQPAEVNPGVAGTYLAYGRFYQASGETPTFPIGTVILSAP